MRLRLLEGKIDKISNIDNIFTISFYKCQKGKWVADFFFSADAGAECSWPLTAVAGSGAERTCFGGTPALYLRDIY